MVVPGHAAPFLILVMGFPTTTCLTTGREKRIIGMRLSAGRSSTSARAGRWEPTKFRLTTTVGMGLAVTRRASRRKPPSLAAVTERVLWGKGGLKREKRG